MKRIWLLFGGFSERLSEEQFGKLTKRLKEKAVIVNYLAEARKEKLFSLARRSARDAVKEALKMLKAKKLQNVNTILAYSYGIIPAIFSAFDSRFYRGNKMPQKLIVVSPVFGEKSIKWKWYEKVFLLFPSIFPGFGELEKKQFWQEIFSKLFQLREEGIKITFLIPSASEGWQDGRVQYQFRDIEKMMKLGKVKYLPVGGHKAAVQNSRNIQQIIEEIIE